MKLTQIQGYLIKNKIDLLFLQHPDPNITYFAQTQPTDAVLLISSNKAIFYISKLDITPKIKNIKTRTLSKEWRKQIKNDKSMKIAINKTCLTLKSFEELKKIYPKANFFDISMKFNELRAQKTSQEIKKIHKACKITTHAFNQLVKELPKKTLKTEQDVALYLEKEIRMQNAELAFPTIVATDKNTAIPHHKTSIEKLRKGFLLLDFGAKFQNYCSDMTRMVYLGNPSKEEKKIYNFLLQVQEKVIESIEEGKSFDDLYNLTKKNLVGYAKNFIHNLGHGIGVEIHESPVFSNEDEKIEEDKVFTIEPGVYFPGKFGLRIEDTVVFNGKEAKILTEAKKDLICFK